jgi:hypothetical protein
MVISAITSLIKHLLKNPSIFGISMGVMVLLINILVAVVTEHSINKGVSLLVGFGYFIILVPVSVTIQMGLFAYYRNIVMATRLCNPDKVAFSGSALSSATMTACVVCCAFQLSGILPTVGFLASALSFLPSYRDILITIGLTLNAIGSVFILRAIILHKKKTVPIQ